MHIPQPGAKSKFSDIIRAKHNEDGITNEKFFLFCSEIMTYIDISENN